MNVAKIILSPLASLRLEGLVFATTFIPVSSDKRLEPFMKGYIAKYKERPDPWAGEFYDAVGLIFEAVKANGYVVDSKQIGEFSRNLTSKEHSYSGILGNVYFDETDVCKPFIIYFHYRNAIAFNDIHLIKILFNTAKFMQCPAIGPWDIEI